VNTATDTPAAPAERRLHPWSWLFVLLQQLRQFVVPLVALVVFGRRGPSNMADWAPLMGVAALVGISVLQYFTYRYRIGSSGITIRNGLLQRTWREIPFARIHNVALHQTLLHRIFGVAEVRLEAAGGRRPEAQMRVLGLADALALEQLVRHRGGGTAGTPAPAAAQAQDEVLLALPPAEVVRLGLVSNRGMIVVAAGLGAVAQMLPDQMAAGWVTYLLEEVLDELLGQARRMRLGWAGTAAAALVLFSLAVAALRLLSVALALAQYFGFRLTGDRRRLTVERGLFARLRSSVAPRRIQAWYLQETLLHRLLGRRSLRIDTAVGGREDDPRKLRDLAPIATPATCDALVGRLLPGVAWPPPHWQGLPPGTAWRLFAGDLPWTLLVAAVLAWQFGAWGLLALLWLPWAAYAAWRQAGYMGYAVDARLVAVRGGWWSRWWRFAEIDKLQGLRLTRSPVDRWLGTASLWLDTAGAGGMSPPLRIRFLPEAQARALYRQLGRTLAARRLRW